MSMRTVLRVENGDYVAGLGGSTKASQVFMSDGVTSVEDAINAIPVLKSVEVSATTSANGNVPVSKITYPNVVGAVMLTPDNSSLRLTGGTSTNWYLFAYNDYNNTRLNNTAITYKLYYLE